MDVRPLPTVEEIAAWMQVPKLAVEWAEKLAAPAYDLRRALCGVYTSVPLGVYADLDEKVAIYATEGCTRQDVALVKSALSRVLPVQDAVLTPADLADGRWIKVAYSPALAGLTNFFTGQSFGHPSPMTSMLTSGLVGAGLGYGAGALGEYFMPEKWERGRLRKTLAMAGAGIGAAPGLIWGMTNKGRGLPFNDGSLFAGPAAYHGPYPDISSLVPPANNIPMPEQMETDNQVKAPSAPNEPKFASAWFKEAADDFCHRWFEAQRQTYKEAWGDDDAGGAAQDEYGPGDAPSRQTGPMAINVDALGHTLWESGAKPQVAGMTMGALAAAQQMPGGTDRPNWVTPMQMANLAAHMGAGYASGAIVGDVLGLLTGMPRETQEKLRQTGAYLGIVESVVPRLFGR